MSKVVPRNGRWGSPDVPETKFYSILAESSGQAGSWMGFRRSLHRRTAASSAWLETPGQVRTTHESLPCRLVPYTDEPIFRFASLESPRSGPARCADCHAAYLDLWD